MHFHIIIHSINKNGNYAFHTYILINHHRIPCICSCVLNTLMHLLLNVNTKQKKLRIKNMKILHTFMYARTHLTCFKIYFETLLMRSWSQPHFFQNFIGDPLGTVKVLTSP